VAALQEHAMLSENQQFEPVTSGYLRREAKCLHLYCLVCGHEREFDVSRPPFDHMPDRTVALTLGQVKVGSKPKFHGASAEQLSAGKPLRFNTPPPNTAAKPSSRLRRCLKWGLGGGSRDIAIAGVLPASKR
jgi:hypothetical protein